MSEINLFCTLTTLPILEIKLEVLFEKYVFKNYKSLC